MQLAGQIDHISADLGHFASELCSSELVAVAAWSSSLTCRHGRLLPHAPFRARGKRCWPMVRCFALRSSPASDIAGYPGAAANAGHFFFLGVPAHHPETRFGFTNPWLQQSASGSGLEEMCMRQLTSCVEQHHIRAWGRGGVPGRPKIGQKSCVVANKGELLNRS